MKQTSRRELLKFFAAGTIIAPIAATEVRAQLIETPKVELIKQPRNALIELPVKPLDLQNVRYFELACHLNDGSIRTLKSIGISEASGKVAAVPGWDDIMIRFSVLDHRSPMVERQAGVIWGEVTLS